MVLTQALYFYLLRQVVTYFYLHACTWDSSASFFSMRREGDWYVMALQSRSGNKDFYCEEVKQKNAYTTTNLFSSKLDCGTWIWNAWYYSVPPGQENDDSRAEFSINSCSTFIRNRHQKAEELSRRQSNVRGRCKYVERSGRENNKGEIGGMSQQCNHPYPLHNLIVL